MSSYDGTSRTLFLDGIKLEAENLPEGCEEAEHLVVEFAIALGDWLFSNFKNLRTVRLPDSLMSVGTGCFYGCVSLRSLMLPESVGMVKDWAFGNCYRLESLNSPASLRVVGKNAIYGCDALVSPPFPVRMMFLDSGVTDPAKACVR